MCGGRRVYVVWPSSFPMGNNHSIHVSRTPFPTVRCLVRRLRFWGGPSSLASRRSGLAILGLAWAFLLGGSRDRGCLLSNALTNSIAFSKSSRPCHSSCSLPQLFGLLPSPLIPKRRRQIAQAGQRVWMLLPQHPLSRLHRLHLQLFGLLPSPLIPVRRCQIGHAAQRGRMLLPQHPLSRLHHLTQEYAYVGPAQAVGL
jgi:hypothetical protein